MYSYNIRISYSMVDAEGSLKLESLFSLFQDCSSFQSEDGGATFDYLDGNDFGWIVAQYNLEVKELPRIGQLVKVTTIPYSLRGSYGLRAFEMRSEKGNLLATCDSIWMLLHKSTQKTASFTDTILGAYAIDDKPDYCIRTSKLNPIDKTARVHLGTAEVSPLFIDSNHHMNNTFYIGLAERLLPSEIKYNRVRVVYKKSAKLGDKILVEGGFDDQAYQILLSDGQEIFAIVEFIDEDIKWNLERFKS